MRQPVIGIVPRADPSHRFPTWPNFRPMMPTESSTTSKIHKEARTREKS